MQSAAIDSAMALPWPLLTVTAAGCLVILLCAGGIVRSFLPVMKCAFRLKYSISLADSMFICHCRDLYAVSCVIPFALICVRYDIYPPAEGLDPSLSLVATAAAMTAYYAVRRIVSFIIAKKLNWVREREWKTCEMMSFTFFAILTTVMAASIALFILTGTDDVTANSILTWEIAVFYTIFFIRRAQIFKFYGSFSETLLYLCTLEIFPSILLLASASVF